MNPAQDVAVRGRKQLLHWKPKRAARPGRFVSLAMVIALLAIALPSHASMTWSARAIDPSSLDALRKDNKLLNEVLFGEQPGDFAAHLDQNGRLDPTFAAELQKWAEKRNAEVKDTAVDLDKAWHGIHFLLTGRASPNGALASKVIFGSENIGPDNGYGPARVVKPNEVKAIASLLDSTTPEMLHKRFDAKKMTQAKIYPDIIWEREGEEAFNYVLESYKRLVAFYKRAAERGQAVVLVIS